MGVIGKAFLFDGGSVVVAPVDFTGPMTVDLWVRSTDPVPPLFASALSSADVPAAPYFQFDSNGGSNWRFLTTGEATFGPLDNVSFRHLAMTFDGTKITTYYDGQPVGTIVNANAGFKSLRIGVNRQGDVPLKGAVDEVHIWKRALSATEIAQLHDKPRADLCATSVCGDGNVDAGESCDDGNTTSNDGCTADCKNECSALDFNGDGYGLAAAPSALGVKSVTLAGWYKAAVGAPYGTLAQKIGNTLGGHITYGIDFGPTGVGARLQTDLNAIFLDLKYAAAIPDGQWHHCAVTYDETTGNGILYYDGSSVATGTQGTGLVTADASRPFLVGASEYNDFFEYFAKASIADVVVYDKPLTAMEVSGLAQKKYPAITPLARYRTLEGMGTTSADASGNGHTLTLVNGGWVSQAPLCMP
jgi:cysteine-rich repeat protein